MFDKMPSVAIQRHRRGLRGFHRVITRAHKIPACIAACSGPCVYCIIEIWARLRMLRVMPDLRAPGLHPFFSNLFAITDHARIVEYILLPVVIYRHAF